MNLNETSKFWDNNSFRISPNDTPNKSTNKNDLNKSNNKDITDHKNSP